MKNRIVIRTLVFLMSVSLFAGGAFTQTNAGQSVSSNSLSAETELCKPDTSAKEKGLCVPQVVEDRADSLEKEVPCMHENQEELPDLEEEYPLMSLIDLSQIQWEGETDEQLNHYLGMSEWEQIGMWLSGMEDKELKALLERDTVLNQNTVIYEPDREEPLEMVYYEYAMQKYRQRMMMRAAYPAKTSGYWKTEIIQVNEVGTPVKTSVITYKISGVDTSSPTSERQKVTIAKSISDNWFDVAWQDKTSTCKTYKADASSSPYPNVYAYMNFQKPAGYKVSVSYNITSKFHALYWNPVATFGEESYFGGDGIISELRHTYPDAKVSNGRTTEPLVLSQYEGRHYLCSIINMFANAGIGTTKTPTNGNLIQTILLIPSTYNVDYSGNGATEGAVAPQSCSYNVNYLAQSNGFSRQYTVSFEGNLGTPDVSSKVSNYTFLGWGINQNQTVNIRPGDSYQNLTAVDGGKVNMYALWQPESIELPGATRTGYRFAGWNIGNAGTGYTPVSNVTAIAKWQPNKYKIEFRSAGGSECEPITVVYDQAVLLPSPMRAGYIFNGWKGENGLLVGSVKNLATEDGAVVTLTADWTPETRTPYTIRYYKQPAPEVTDKNAYELFSLEKGDVIDGELVQYGTTDSSVTIAAMEIPGYVTPGALTVQIAGDGSTLVCFYYDIKKEEPIVKESLSASDEEINEIAKKIAAGLSFSMDIDGARYEIVQTQDGTLGIKFLSTNESKVVIPDVVTIGEKVYRITEIQSSAFKENKVIKEVEMSANISKIGDMAFKGCTSLEKVTLREGLVTIGDKAFYGCTSLKNISFPKTLQSIGTGAFESCSGLKNISLQEGLLTIGKKAFYGCKSLLKITIPKTVLEIGSYAFAKCNALKSVKFAPGCKLLSMGNGTFRECKALTKIVLPSKLTKISNKMFWGCKKLKSVTGGKAVSSIGAEAFRGCAKLTGITIPSKVQSIGKKAFYKCKKLKKVTIKTKALTSVGKGAFKECRKGIVFVVPKEKKEAYSKMFKGKY